MPGGAQMSEPLPELSSLRIGIERGVLFVTIAHPPINLLDASLVRQLRRLLSWLEGASRIRVVVFRSADPDFFLAHADLRMIIEYGASPPRPHAGLLPFNDMCERYRGLPQLTIGQIEGRARGGGSEFVLALDLRFAALGRALLAQPEAALGLIPGGGATQRLPHVVGRARALEIMLGCEDLDAERAQQYGYVNRALPAAHITGAVDALAFRAASYPPGLIARIKRSVDFGLELHAGLQQEEAAFAELAREDATRAQLERLLQAGVQQRAAELGDFLRLCGAAP